MALVAADVFFVAEHVWFLLGITEETAARGAKAVVEAEAAMINQEEKCRNFMLCGAERWGVQIFGKGKRERD